jgi:hypothetical protein
MKKIQAIAPYLPCRWIEGYCGHEEAKLRAIMFT